MLNAKGLSGFCATAPPGGATCRAIAIPILHPMTKIPPLDIGLRNGVQVWLIRLDRESPQANRLVRWLSEDERERSERFRFPRDRHRFVVCRAALRTILGACLGGTPGEVCFDYSEYGRPRLTRDKERNGPYFNVSHSHNLGCIAVASGFDVGVDVEAVRHLHDLDQMIRKTLVATEKRHFAALPASDRLRTFFRYWTLKESLLKVLGVGLQWPLSGIEIDLGSKGRIASMPAKIPARGQFLLQELDLGNDYCGALATESAELPHIEYRNWTSGENGMGTEHPVLEASPFWGREALD